MSSLRTCLQLLPVLRLYPVFPNFPWFLILSTVVYSVLSLRYLYRSKHHNSTRNMKLCHQDVSCLSVSTVFILLLLPWNASSKIWAFLSLYNNSYVFFSPFLPVAVFAIGDIKIHFPSFSVYYYYYYKVSLVYKAYWE